MGLFGTDGIRGVAGEMLTPGLAAQVGRGAAVVLSKRLGVRPRFVIGRDTRVSGQMLEAALVAGITSGGGDVETLGVVPTPAIAALVRERGADSGVVVSASHNPFADNGIKFFNGEGFKLSDDEEAEIEEHVADHDLRSQTGAGIGRVAAVDGAVEAYVEKLTAAIPLDLSGMRIAIDCANGATYRSAALGLARPGGQVTVFFDQPDGLNINAGCGSVHVEALQQHVRAGGFDLGFAFDGDGDRVLAIDGHGEVVDGDVILAILARHLRDRQLLRHETVVTTLMANLGFRHAMKREGIAVRTTAVGDRYVLADMLDGDFVLGGEQCGHIIDRDISTTGDGLATALLLLQALRETDVPLHEAATIVTLLPQRLVNVAVRDREALDGAEAVWTAIRAEEERLEGAGRILVRPSGTEPLVRVMAEAPTQDECDAVCDRIARVIERELG